MPTRNIVKSFKIEVAKGKRKCHASPKHEIAPGEAHFVYETSPMVRANICKQCAPAIFDVAGQHLAKVRSALGV